MGGNRGFIGLTESGCFKYWSVKEISSLNLFLWEVFPAIISKSSFIPLFLYKECMYDACLPRESDFSIDRNLTNFTYGTKKGNGNWKGKSLYNVLTLILNTSKVGPLYLSTMLACCDNEHYRLPQFLCCSYRFCRHPLRRSFLTSSSLLGRISSEFAISGILPLLAYTYVYIYTYKCSNNTKSEVIRRIKVVKSTIGITTSSKSTAFDWFGCVEWNCSAHLIYISSYVLSTSVSRALTILWSYSWRVGITIIV